MDDQLPNPGWDKKPIIGQHYVRSITYRGNLIPSLKFTTRNDKKKLAIKVDAGVKAKVSSVGIGAQFKKLK